MEMFALYDLRVEEKVIGPLSWRQTAYAVVGLLLGVPPLVQLLIGLVHGSAGIWLLAIPWILVVAGVVLLLGWAPAGIGPLPGPPYDVNNTPQDPPLRLDEWLLRWWRWKHQVAYLPWIHLSLEDEPDEVVAN